MNGSNSGRRSPLEVDRVVVVHGPADAATNAALAGAGLVVRLEVGETTVWAPAEKVLTEVAVSGSDKEPEPQLRLLLTVAQAAAALGVGRTTAYQLISSGQLEVVHVGRCARVPTEAVKELVERLRRAKESQSLPPGTVGLPGNTGASQRKAAFPDTRTG